MASDAEIPSLFLDADVLVAGSASTTGASHLLLQLAELGVLRAVSCEQVRREAERTLVRKLPGALPAFDLLAETACAWGENPPAGGMTSFAGQADEKDLLILVAAIRSGCGVLVTFNTRDYRPEGGVIRILRPGEVVAEIRERLRALG